MHLVLSRHLGRHHGGGLHHAACGPAHASNRAAQTHGGTGQGSSGQAPPSSPSGARSARNEFFILLCCVGVGIKMSWHGTAAMLGGEGYDALHNKSEPCVNDIM